MDLVAETAEEDRYEASDDQKRDQRRQRKFSKDDDSQVADDNNDVSCFLDILKGTNYEQILPSEVQSNVLLPQASSENAIDRFESQIEAGVNLQTDIMAPQLQLPMPFNAHSNIVAPTDDENDTMELVQAVSQQLASTFEAQYNAKDPEVLDLFSPDAQFTLLVQQGEESGAGVEERQMTSFEAISLMDSEGIGQMQLPKESLHLDFNAESGLSLFYATFDGKLQLYDVYIPYFIPVGICNHSSQGQRTFRISFMLGNGPEPEQQRNFKVLATKMQFK